MNITVQKTVANFLENAKLISSNIKHVTLSELEVILSEIKVINKVNMFASVIQVTQPKLTVKCRDTKIPFDKKVLKVSKVSISLNSEYKSNVKNQLIRETKQVSDYKQGKNTMPIEKCEANNFFGYFNGNGVIEYRPNNDSKPKTQYFYSVGNELENVAKNDIPNVLPMPRKATNQGTEKEIFWRKLYVKNIYAIKINGVTYQRV